MFFFICIYICSHTFLLIHCNLKAVLFPTDGAHQVGTWKQQQQQTEVDPIFIHSLVFWCLSWANPLNSAALLSFTSVWASYQLWKICQTKAERTWRRRWCCCSWILIMASKCEPKKDGTETDWHMKKDNKYSNMAPFLMLLSYQSGNLKKKMYASAYTLMPFSRGLLFLIELLLLTCMKLKLHGTLLVVYAKINK